MAKRKVKIADPTTMEYHEVEVDDGKKIPGVYDSPEPTEKEKADYRKLYLQEVDGQEAGDKLVDEEYPRIGQSIPSILRAMLAELIMLRREKYGA